LRQAVAFWTRHRAHAGWLIGILSLAIAVATAVWSIGYGVWLGPLPFQQPDRLMSVGWVDERAAARTAVVSVPEYEDLQRAARDFLTVASWEAMPTWHLVESGRAIDVRIARATGNLFEVLGVAPALGPGFTRLDASSASGDVAVISSQLWRVAFGADPNAIGRIVRIASYQGSHTVRILGVLPPSVQVPLHEGTTDFIMAMPDGPPAGQQPTRRAYSRTVIGRLARDVTPAQGEAKLTAIFRQIDRDHPVADRTRRASLVSMHEYLYGESRPFVILLGVAALLVLIIAMANGAGVMLVLMSRRTGEFAVRLAIGATPSHVARQLFGEAMVVAAASAACSILLGYGLVRAFILTAPGTIPRLDAIAMDWSAWGLALALALSSALCSGALGAIWHHKRGAGGGLRLSGTAAATASSRVLIGRRIALAVQTALVLALLAAAGLITKTLHHLVNQPLGFDLSRVTVAEVKPTQSYFADRPRYQALLDSVRQHVASAPGSRQVAIAFDPPLGQSSRVRVDFDDGLSRFVATKMVSDGFFSVLRVTLLAGRDFQRADYATGQFVVVNRLFAQAHFGGVEAAVGREITIGPARFTIVGVVTDVREDGLATPLEPVMYPILSSARWTPGRFHVVTRDSRAIPAGLAETIERAIHRADATLHVRVSTLEDRFRNQTAVARIQSFVLGSLAALMLCLSTLGLYATIAQVVEDRQRELAIRSVLGASSGSLVAVTLRSIIAPVVAGIGGAGILSVVVARTVDRFLFEVTPFEPTTWMGATALLLIAGASAAWLPARRAANIDPARLLRLP
jgi:predicted permease